MSVDTATLWSLGAFVVCMFGAWTMLSLLSRRNMTRAEERLERIGRPKSLAEIELTQKRPEDRFSGLKETMSSLGNVLEPGSDLEKSSLKIRLANAGFRSESAAGIYQGLRVASLLLFVGPALLIFGLKYGMTYKTAQYVLIFGGIGLYLPSIVLWYLRSKRQQEIFLTLPDALDLMVVCVESGLGLDAAMRRVTDEMKHHAKVISEEFSLANLQLQMGRPRREVLHDLGVRTGVDDVRSLAAILIQADRFGSSIAQALRVQSDSMRTRRRQLAEEKAAKTAVQLIFPLVLFIFPGIFVVLVGPAAINIANNLLPRMK
ncbi:MAG TPA: type II secretion system F family protein [Gemmataceae bacterium]|nr:type II secretion system F family protein [Gemmataceae bacterium]